MPMLPRNAISMPSLASHQFKVNSMFTATELAMIDSCAKMTVCVNGLLKLFFVVVVAVKAWKPQQTDV